MTSVIDSLSIKLGLDVADYKKGAKEVTDSQKTLTEASTKTSKEMEAGNKRVTEGLTSLKVGLLEVVAIFAAGVGLKDFVIGTMETQASLGRLSTNLNMNAKDLKAWGIVAEEMGGKAEDAFSSLSAVQSGIGEAMANGHSGFTDMARKMGVNITPEMIKNQDYSAVMGAISKRLQSLPRPLAQYDAGQLGVGSLFNVLMDKNLGANLEHAKTLTGVTEQSTAAAERMQKQWVDFGEKMEGVKDRVWMKMEPVIERLGTQFANWVEKIDWDKLITQIGKLFDKINDVVQAFGGWKGVLIVLGGVLALQLLSPLTGLIGSLIRLIPLLASTTAGMVALSAAAGYGIGTWISKQIEDTPFGKGLGEFEAHVMSALGSDTATTALMSNQPGFEGGHVSAARGRQLQAIYNAMHADAKRRSGNAASTASKGLPRGIRNNNPGNLNYAGQEGAHLEYAGGRFAAFDTMAEGVHAMSHQLVRYIARGTDTIRKIVTKYAPSSDNNDVNAYIADLVKQTGDGADQKLGGGDIPALMVAMINHENGRGYVSSNDIHAGIKYGARQSAVASRGGNTHSSEVRIDTINVNAPQATDARGIASAMQLQMKAVPLFAQVDTGTE